MTTYYLHAVPLYVENIERGYDPDPLDDPPGAETCSLARMDVTAELSAQIRAGLPIILSPSPTDPKVGHLMMVYTRKPRSSTTVRLFLRPWPQPKRVRFTKARAGRSRV